MAFRMSEQPQTIKIYNLLPGTNEFIGEGDAHIPPHTGLPANSTDIAPPVIPAGFVAVFNSDEASWHLVEDHRGKTVYDVDTGDALFISELGPLPENVTWLSPDGEYQKWNGTSWVTDTEAQRSAAVTAAVTKRDSLLNSARQQLVISQTKLLLGRSLTENEQASLDAWLDYVDALHALDFTSIANKADVEAIIWPDIPDENTNTDTQTFTSTIQ
ncbi:TPA: tail fiber assembly protein [Escherichia coli]|uniref:tail fiber assembly protein n=1 Tax=Escherichia coli TaxID=562 RepID=UPI0007A005F9|nr:tail fiber assembly protein [Escherichia coli]EHW2951317.1 tail fiber assembly protein [Escherichia coli]EIQ9793102.1 tail fiber assembly protein [Escherichia coli]EJJ5493068.1 tail fiber assembly protein [Escherichia coli]KYV77355.1 phage tail protein [Escherichia coli]HAX2892485.1 tail fiber assembly protein [Escherichia coli]